jgi:hypothetical protein
MNAAGFRRDPAPAVAPPATSGLNARCVGRRGRLCPQADSLAGGERGATNRPCPTFTGSDTHAYVTSGVAISSQIRADLVKLGFAWMEKPGKNSVHTWYQIPIHQHAAFMQELNRAAEVVGTALGNATR